MCAIILALKHYAEDEQRRSEESGAIYRDKLHAFVTSQQNVDNNNVNNHVIRIIGSSTK